MPYSPNMAPEAPALSVSGWAARLTPAEQKARRNRSIAIAVILAALVLTQLWFPFRYFRLALHFEAGLSWVLLGLRGGARSVVAQSHEDTLAHVTDE